MKFDIVCLGELVVDLIPSAPGAQTYQARAGGARLVRAVPEPGPDQILVRNIWMSVDPYMRGRMNDRKSYSPPFEVGKPLDGRAVGQVLKSNHPKLTEGSVVSNTQGWREYFVSMTRATTSATEGSASFSRLAA